MLVFVAATLGVGLGEVFGTCEALGVGVGVGVALVVVLDAVVVESVALPRDEGHAIHATIAASVAMANDATIAIIDRRAARRSVAVVIDTFDACVEGSRASSSDSGAASNAGTLPEDST